jgi:hypothetical protein
VQHDNPRLAASGGEYPDGVPTHRFYSAVGAEPLKAGNAFVPRYAKGVVE